MRTNIHADLKERAVPLARKGYCGHWNQRQLKPRNIEIDDAEVAEE
jgi:predicted PilT family ATPase